MAQLIVRNLEEKLVRLLRIRAAERGRSTEAEHREILKEALLPKSQKPPIKELLRKMPFAGEDRDFERVQDSGRTLDL